MTKSPKNPHGLYVGQQLYFVPSEIRKRNPVTATVTAVGRKWVSIEMAGWWGVRIDIQTLIADGGGYSSPGNCYFSQEEYTAKVLRQRTWDSLRRAIYAKPSTPDSVTREAIQKAAELLGLSGAM